jgi:flagellar biosynthesis protein FlhF
MSDALLQVKRDLGRDAVILNTRTVNRGGLWRLGGRRLVEITATKQTNVLHPSARRGNIVRGSDGRGVQAEGIAVPQPPTVTARDEAVAELRREVGAVRSLVQDLLSESREAHLSSVPQDLHQTYLHLIQQEVAAEITAELLRQLRRELNPRQLADQAIVNARLAAYIEAMVPQGGPVVCDRSDRPKVIVLVGPTGVGKTTTIAKLAANFKLREHRSVALVTIDTYRIAAVDQLRTYAQILDVPLKVVLSPTEFRDVISGLRSHDLIFVDTAGRSQNDTIKLNELRGFFDLSKPDEVHLVLAGNCSQKVMLHAANQFGPLGIDRVIFTKLDEAIGFGVMLSVVKQVNSKLSYLTTGQDVPDDIEVGSGRRLAQLIMGSPSLAGAAGN